MALALALQELFGGHLIEDMVVPIVTLPFATYALGAWAGRRDSIAGIVVTVAIVTVAVIAADAATSDVLLLALVTVGPWLTGRIVATRSELAAELRDKADRLEADQEKQAALAVAGERARIARELHDVVAHNVSVMVVQAAAARRMIDHDAGKAAEALNSVEKTGREALKEMRRMVGMLGKDVDDELALAPQPSVSELDWLVERARDAGLDVDLTIEGEQRRLDSSVDLSAFRIVQEALRNTLKHAGPARAHVRLKYGEHDVELDVSDDGRGAPSAAAAENAPGTGLLGMRERVAMLGGEIEAGYRKDGGFGVRAKLPLERED